MKVPKVVLDTDLFLGHLQDDRTPSLLRLAVQKFFCYTTVFHAIELFAAGKSEADRQAFEDSMAVVKILGLNAKNAPTFGRQFAASGKRSALATLAGGLCLESRLPLVTGRRALFRGSGVLLIPAEMLRKFETGDEILKAVAKAGRRTG
ncbi:MAG: hypothetical protein OEV30_08650 [Ignavibacteria bacterium]|nr:hypothetical protein [Ignavibacteria bacterium]